MKVKKAEAVAMFLAAGYGNPASWSDDKLLKFIENAPEKLPNDALKKIKDKGLKNLAKAILDHIVDKEDEAEFTLVGEARAAKKGKGRQEDDEDEGEEDEDESEDDDDSDSDDEEDDSEEDSEDDDEDEDDEPKKKKGKGKTVAKDKSKKKGSKRQDDDEDEAPKKKKKKGSSSKGKVERDNFGNALDSRAHKINMAMSRSNFMTLKEIEKKSKANAVSPHLYTLVQNGFAIKKEGKGYKLIKNP